MRVGIVGAGAVGLLLGARLARAGHRVAVLARGERLRALQAGGLRAILPDGVIAVAPEVASDEPARIGVVDALFPCTKAYDLDAAAAACAPLVGAGTLVVPIQNGVEADAVLRARLPAGAVAPGLVYVMASSRAPGEVLQASGFVRLAFGPRDGQFTAPMRQLESACQEAGIEATLVSDITLRLWEKLVMLAPVAALTCLADLAIGPLRSSTGTRSLLEEAMHEVVAVGRAHGVALADDAVARALALVDTLPPAGTSSMHEDRRAGRRLEIDVLSGAVVRLGRERSVAAPIHRLAHACLSRPDAVAGSPGA